MFCRLLSSTKKFGCDIGVALSGKYFKSFAGNEDGTALGSLYKTRTNSVQKVCGRIRQKKFHLTVYSLKELQSCKRKIFSLKKAICEAERVPDKKVNKKEKFEHPQIMLGGSGQI